MRRGTSTGLAAILAVCAALVIPTVALAAPPPNDDFAAAESIAGFPATATGTNLEATTEEGEPVPTAAIGAQGHSVWFEWEATSDGFVTVSSCDSDFFTTLGVYTGATVTSLTEVAGDFASLGPDCPDSAKGAVTFEAVSGTTYEIVVDGYETIFPSEPYGQGNIALEIAETPAPPNDDFAAATVLVGGPYLGTGPYAAGAEGFSWNASKEPGEPAHAGNPGGASVWYRWTAPFTGIFGVTACGRFEKSVLGIYTGDSLSALTPVASDDHSCNFLHFEAIGGTTYHLAIDGVLDEASGKPLMGHVSINIAYDPPEPAAEVQQGAPQWHPTTYEVPPQTKIDKSSLRAARGTVKFWFSASEGASFRCRLDSRPWQGCSPGKAYRHLKPGRHAFRVQAVDLAGNVDRTPAVARFKVPPRSHRHR